MKKLTLAMLMLLALVIGSPGQIQLEIESILSDSVSLFMKSTNISQAVKSFNSFTDTALTDVEKKDLMKDVIEFHQKTGINPLDEGSLQKAGIATDKPLGFAYFPETDGQERMMIYLPVLNGKTFPMKFVQIIKSIDDKKKDRDVYPVITSYKSFNMYQIQKDIFTTSIGDYFIIGSRGELIKNAIDLSMSSEKVLSKNPLYIDYSQKKKKGSLVDFFATKEFLEEAFSSVQKKMQKNKMKKRRKGPSRGDMSMNDQDMIVPVQYSNKDQGMKGAKQPSPFEAVDYASLAIGLEAGKMNLSIGANFNNKNPLFTMVMGLIKTGLTERALNTGKAVIYSYVSLDLNYLENMCKQPVPFCMQYNEFKKGVMTEYGVDLSKDFIPYSYGVANVIMERPETGQFVVFLPMTNYVKGKFVWQKIQKTLKKKYAKSKKYGETRIGKGRACWFVDKKNKKQYFFYNKKGLYITDAPGLLKNVEKNKQINRLKGESAIVKKMNGNTFFLTYVKKNLFLNSLLSAQTRGNKNLSGMTTSIGDIYLTGEKDGNYLTVDLEIAMKAEKRK